MHFVQFPILHLWQALFIIAYSLLIHSVHLNILSFVSVGLYPSGGK